MLLFDRPFGANQTFAEYRFGSGWGFYFWVGFGVDGHDERAFRRPVSGRGTVAIDLCRC